MACNTWMGGGLFEAGKTGLSEQRDLALQVLASAAQSNNFDECFFSNHKICLFFALTTKNATHFQLGRKKSGNTLNPNIFPVKQPGILFSKSMRWFFG